MKRIIYIIVVTLLLSSCGIYKKYERPNDLDTSRLFRDTATVDGILPIADTTSLGSTPWREVFTDPFLQELIDSALVKNTDLRSAALTVTQAKAILSTARLAFVPAFSFSPNGTLRSWDNGKASQTYSLPVEASWQIDLFGSLTNAKRAQQATLLQSKDYQRAVQCGLVAGVANCYYTLLMLDKQLQLTEEMVDLTKKTYELMQKQKTLAQTDESAVMSAKANYYSVRSSVAEIKRQIRETENSLSLLPSKAPHSIKRSTFDQQRLPEKFSVGIPVQLLANRPDVHANEMALANCFYNVNKARSAFYPSINVGGSVAWTNSSGSGIVNPGKMLASAVGSLTQPIFANGRLVAQLKVAKAQQEQALLAWQQSVLQAGSEVSNALVLYQTSAERSALEQVRVESLQRNVEVAEKMFVMAQNGNYLNVITAQQSLLQAQLSQISNEFNRIQAIVNLYNALGGGDK